MGVVLRGDRRRVDLVETKIQKITSGERCNSGNKAPGKGTPARNRSACFYLEEGRGILEKRKFEGRTTGTSTASKSALIASKKKKRKKGFPSPEEGRKKVVSVMRRKRRKKYRIKAWETRNDPFIQCAQAAPKGPHRS